MRTNNKKNRLKKWKNPKKTSMRRIIIKKKNMRK